MADYVSGALQKKLGGIVELRRQLHAMPEIGFRETRTAAVIADRLKAAGLEVHTGIRKTGVVSGRRY